MSEDAFDNIKHQIREFASERDWDKFHSPKNLAMALNVEAGELMEHFQWLTEEESQQLDDGRLTEIADEIADVQVYLIRLADRLSIDIPAAVSAKMIKNAKKYPAELVKGRSDKYHYYQK
ncbi:MAG: nucleotide pyrophosphohydrolase [Motiliproteus sp.]